MAEGVPVTRNTYKVSGTSSAPYFGDEMHVFAFQCATAPIVAYVHERQWRFRWGYAPSIITHIEEVNTHGCS
jgi:hypothetical protein